jgi:hypothetical protein
MAFFKRLKTRIARAKVRNRRRQDLKELDARQDLLIRTGDKALAQKDPLAMRKTIGLIRLFNRSLLEKARRFKREKNLEMAERCHQNIRRGIQMIKNFQNEIQKVEN